MRQIGPLRTDATRSLERLLDIEVGRVRIAPPQRVDYQDFHSAQRSTSLGRDRFPVNDDAERTGAEAVGVSVPVGESERVQFDARRVDGSSCFKCAQVDPWHARFRIQSNGGIEDVREASLELLGVLVCHVCHERRISPQAEDPEIVDAVYVVRVKVTEEDGIDASDIGGDQLLAQFGGRVHEQDSTTPFNHETVPRPSIAWITRSAHRATAPDDRDSEARTAAEETETHDQTVSIRTMLVVPRT